MNPLLLTAKTVPAIFGTTGFTTISRSCVSLLMCALLLVTPVTLSGCTGKPFQFKNLAKSDIDLVIDNHIAAYKSLCRELTVKLYKRNPRELAKVRGQTVDSRLRMLFSQKTPSPAELQGRRGTNAIELAFDPAYRGDRVFALMYGLIGMIHSTYNFQSEYFITTKTLNEQYLYNSAHNIEIIAWRLIHRTQPNGQPFLATYGVYQGSPNLSFERLFGKLIANQYLMARIMADKNNRRINFVIQSMASAVLLPLGI